VITSAKESKVYGLWDELHNDIRLVLKIKMYPGPFVLIYLHECGGITRCQISKDEIKWSEPETWRETEGVEHNYCYGCSNV